jgi:hypothetical protein
MSRDGHHAVSAKALNKKQKKFLFKGTAADTVISNPLQSFQTGLWLRRLS